MGVGGLRQQPEVPLPLGVQRHGLGGEQAPRRGDHPRVDPQTSRQRGRSIAGAAHPAPQVGLARLHLRRPGRRPGGAPQAQWKHPCPNPGACPRLAPAGLSKRLRPGQHLGAVHRRHPARSGIHLGARRGGGHLGVDPGGSPRMEGRGRGRGGRLVTTWKGESTAWDARNNPISLPGRRD